MKEYGTPETRNKRTTVGERRFVRAAGTGFVLRPACGCEVSTATRYEDPKVCPDCGGARLMKHETNPEEMS